MLTHPLLPKLKELRLSGMADSLESRSELARERGLSPVEFLALLLDDEIERRCNARIARMEKAAGFERLRFLNQFDFLLQCRITQTFFVLSQTSPERLWFGFDAERVSEQRLTSEPRRAGSADVDWITARNER